MSARFNRTYAAVAAALVVSLALSAGLLGAPVLANGAESPYDGQGISYIAFCSSDGFTEDHVTQLTFDDQSDAKVVNYDLTKAPDTVVVKTGGQGGGEIYDYPGGSSEGTVVSDSSATRTLVTSEVQNNQNVCPTGETGVKIDLTGSPSYPDSGAFNQVGSR